MQPLQRYARQLDVGRLALEVQRIDGNPAGMPPQPSVGLGRAVTADQIERLTAAEIAVQVMQQVEQVGVHVMNAVVVVIAHDMVDVVQSGRQIFAVAPVHQGCSLLGVDVDQADLAFRNRRVRVDFMTDMLDVAIGVLGKRRACKANRCRRTHRQAKEPSSRNIFRLFHQTAA